MSEPRYDKIRTENDAKLLPRLDAIRQGSDADALELYAKAYLGLLYGIDRRLSPARRVREVANDAVAEAVTDGLQALLERPDLPSPAEIGTLVAHELYHPSTYPVLAGIDLLADDEPGRVTTLPDRTLRAAVCFRYANAALGDCEWASFLMRRRPELAADALCDYWLALLANGRDYAPGLSRILDDTESADLVKRILLPLLTRWPVGQRRYLRELLLAALRHADRELLLTSARRELAREEFMDISSRVWWLATAFLLSPSELGPGLANYAGTSKEKILPLLTFVVSALKQDPGRKLSLPPQSLAGLLRIIAPRFPPELSGDGDTDEISQQVIWLFQRLGQDPTDEAAAALASLREVRVMRICSEILSRTEAEQQRTRGDAEPGRLESLA